MPEFHSIPIGSIVVGERFRKDYGDLVAFSASIKAYGLLQPVVVSRDLQLLAGGRRLAACRALGWPNIAAHFIDECDEVRAREIELEENLVRKDLTWQEESTLTKEIHDLKLALYGPANFSAIGTHGANVAWGNETKPPPAVESGWSLNRTGEIAGVSAAQVAKNIRLANALTLMPRLAKETSATNALRELDRLEDWCADELDRRQRAKEDYARVESVVLCGDATSLITSLATGSVDCIITDPPYGVGIDTSHVGEHRSSANFDDSIINALAILRSITPQLRRVLKPAGHLYAFFPTLYWTEHLSIWRSAGFDVRPIPCIWTKPGGVTGTGNWDFSFATSWEPFLFASNKEQRLAFKRNDVFNFAVELGAARVHAAQKPVELLRELIQISTQPNDVIFDPFAGSGSTLVAASQLRRRFLGYELDPDMHNTAVKRIVTEGKERPYGTNVASGQNQLP